jgi:hypothetical protein
MISDFEAQRVCAADHLWRFQSHLLRPIFVGSDLPVSIASPCTCTVFRPDSSSLHLLCSSWENGARSEQCKL